MLIGLLRSDDLSLGIETTLKETRLLLTGRNSTSCYLLIGTLRGSSNWESTAVPELRNQAAQAAERVLTEIAQRLWTPELSTA